MFLCGALLWGGPLFCGTYGTRLNPPVKKSRVYGKFAPVHVHTDVIGSIVVARSAYGTAETNINLIFNPNSNPNACYAKSG